MPVSGTHVRFSSKGATTEKTESAVPRKLKTEARVEHAVRCRDCRTGVFVYYDDTERVVRAACVCGHRSPLATLGVVAKGPYVDAEGRYFEVEDGVAQVHEHVHPCPPFRFVGTWPGPAADIKAAIEGVVAEKIQEHWLTAHEAFHLPQGSKVQLRRNEKPHTLGPACDAARLAVNQANLVAMVRSGYQVLLVSSPSLNDTKPGVYSDKHRRRWHARNDGIVRHAASGVWTRWHEALDEFAPFEYVGPLEERNEPRNASPPKSDSPQRDADSVPADLDHSGVVARGSLHKLGAYPVGGLVPLESLMNAKPGRYLDKKDMDWFVGSDGRVCTEPFGIATDWFEWTVGWSEHGPFRYIGPLEDAAPEQKPAACEHADPDQRCARCAKEYHYIGGMPDGVYWASGTRGPVLNHVLELREGANRWPHGESAFQRWTEHGANYDHLGPFYYLRPLDAVAVTSEPTDFIHSKDFSVASSPVGEPTKTAKESGCTGDRAACPGMCRDFVCSGPAACQARKKEREAWLWWYNREPTVPVPAHARPAVYPSLVDDLCDRPSAYAAAACVVCEQTVERPTYVRPITEWGEYPREPHCEGCLDEANLRRGLRPAPQPEARFNAPEPEPEVELNEAQLQELLLPTLSPPIRLNVREDEPAEVVGAVTASDRLELAHHGTRRSPCRFKGLHGADVPGRNEEGGCPDCGYVVGHDVADSVREPAPLPLVELVCPQDDRIREARQRKGAPFGDET